MQLHEYGAQQPPYPRRQVPGQLASNQRLVMSRPRSGGAPQAAIRSSERWSKKAILDLQRAAGNGALAESLSAGKAHSGEAAIKGPARTAQRFASSEHHIVGTAGSDGATIGLDIGDPAHPLTHGELVALAGDYFTSPQELGNLAASEGGRAQIRWARFLALGQGSGAGATDAVKKQVQDRYYRLAAVNASHFSQGGRAAGAYEEQHRTAMEEAYLAGATADQAADVRAKVAEAFSQHYLTDMFSAGHIRTPRMDIKAWYASHVPNSGGSFLTYAASIMTDAFDRYGEIPVFVPNALVVDATVEKIREKGGAAVENFDLGDIVSLALHDRENEAGLWVVSEVDLAGHPASGGFAWPEKAKGDNHLGESPTGAAMVEAAIRASLAEIAAARAAGEAATAGGLCLPSAQLRQRFQAYQATLTELRALHYVPHADTARNMSYVQDTSSPRVQSGQLDYRWGSLDEISRASVDQSVKGEVAGQIEAKSSEVEEVVRKAGLSLHARRAFREFASHLREQGITALERAVGRRA